MKEEKRMKKLLALMMALALLLTTAMAEDLVFTGAVEQEEMTDEELIALIHPEYPESDLLSRKLPEDKKTVTVLTHYSLGVNKERFEKLFGGELVEVICGVTEYSSKLQNMISAGNPPDLVVAESCTNPSIATYVNAGLVQPFDPYIDYTVPELSDLQATYDAGIWNGQHYLAPYTHRPLYYMIYNPLIFEENGLETPWDLWERGEWTWDAFREYAQLLNVQNESGSWVSFGTGIPAYAVLTASTGVDYVTMGDGEYTINLTNPAIVRAENYMNNMIYQDDIIKIKAQDAWKGYWNRGMMAMQIVASWTFSGDADIAKAARNGRLGVCPLPQDPENCELGVYNTWGQSGGFCLVNGAKNPEGAALLVRMLAYTSRYEVPELDISWQKSLDSLHEQGFTNEVLYQQYEAFNMDNALISFGYGIMSDLGAWGFMGGQNNWTSYVETILPGVEEAIREMTAE